MSREEEFEPYVSFGGVDGLEAKAETITNAEAFEKADIISIPSCRVASGLQDGGSRKVYSTGAMKEDCSKTVGKGAYHLLPPYPIRKLAEVYRKGAIKYTRDLPISNLQALELMLQLCPCHQTGLLKSEHVATQIYRCIQKECVGLATKYPSVKKMLNLLQDRERILSTGQFNIATEKEVLIELITLDPILVREHVCEVDTNSMPRSDSTLIKQIVCSIYKEMSVQSVENHQAADGLTSTTTITQDNYEGSCVQSATRASGFWGIVSKVFKEHLGTCKIHQSLGLNPDGSFVRHHEGSRNWEKGIPLSRFLDSLKRHVDKYAEGMMDEEHDAQALWNLVGLIHTTEMIKRGLLPEELDDLPSYGIDGVAVEVEEGVFCSKWRKPGKGCENK